MENTEKPWGIETALDIRECNLDVITSGEMIKKFAQDLCEAIEMKRFGDCIAIHFGEDPDIAGYSMAQFIETSLISGHFCDRTGAAYVNVFSCKTYEPQVVIDFCLERLGGKLTKAEINRRRA